MSLTPVCAVCGCEVTASSGEWWLPEQILHSEDFVGRLPEDAKGHRAVVREHRAASPAQEGEITDEMRRGVADGIRAREARERARRERALRPPASHPCVVCGKKLEPVLQSEPFTMHTPIGGPRASRLAYYQCPQCHLMYSPGAADPAQEGD